MIDQGRRTRVRTGTRLGTAALKPAALKNAVMCCAVMWCAVMWCAMSLARLRAADRDRGDVPGWVMITVMTAALVLAILIPFREAIVTAIQNALDSVTSQ